MKRKNPYILIAIIWAVLTVAFAVSSVALLVDGKIAIGAFLVLVACGFAFTTGVLFQQAKEVIEWNNNVVFLEQAHEAFNNFVAEIEKAKSNEPFAEFDNTSEVPFPEVSDKENLR